VTEEQAQTPAAGVSAPSRTVSDVIWLGVAFAFVFVFVVGFVVMAAGVFVTGQPGLVDAGRVEQMVLLSATFLAGLLAGTVPSLLRR
jgi:hypothetical protein